MKTSGNVAASIRQRLLNRARSEKRPFNELLQYYAIERFLYRLSKSDHADRFILKGAMMLSVWEAPELRPTMDIDMLGKTSNNEAVIITQIRDILSIDVEPDGLVFDLESIMSERITESADYEGIRVRFVGTLASARINMQIDIGFGDIVYPKPERLRLPVLLELPAPQLLCYSRESSIAEKFEAMVKFGMLNSRMKDFYDIWLLSRMAEFQGENLANAIRLTFEQRETQLPEVIVAFTEIFSDEKQQQWMVFRKRLQQEHIPLSFHKVIVSLETFLSPIIKSLMSDTPVPRIWEPPGPWKY